MKKLKGNISTLGYLPHSPDKNNDFNVIPGSEITMKGVQQPLTLFPVKLNGRQPEFGNPITAYPGNDYSFPDHDAVVEIPEMKRGGRSKGFPQGMHPLDNKLFSKVMKEAKKKFKVFPSSQVMSWVHSQYKHRGGDYAYDFDYKYENGGPMKNSAIPTAEEFFNFGVVPIGPTGFYMHGGQPCFECEETMMREGGNWIKKASDRMEKKGTKGAFTEYCGGTVTDDCIERGLKSSNPTTRKRAGFAKAMRSIAKKQFGGDVPAEYEGLGDVVAKKNAAFINAVRNQTMNAIMAEEADRMADLHEGLTKFMKKQMGGQSDPYPVFNANQYNQAMYEEASEMNNTGQDGYNLLGAFANMQMGAQDYYVPTAQYGYSMPQYYPANMMLPMNYSPRYPNPYYKMTRVSKNQPMIAWDPSKTSALSSIEMKYGMLNKRSPKRVTLTFQTPYSKQQQAQQQQQPAVPVNNASGGADMTWQNSSEMKMPNFDQPIMMDENQLEGRPIASSPTFKYGGLLKFMQLAGQVGPQEDPDRQLPFNPVDLANNPGAFNPYLPENQPMYDPTNVGTDYFQRSPMDYNGQDQNDQTGNLGADDGYTEQKMTFKRKTRYNNEDLVNASMVGANFLAGIAENKQKQAYADKLAARQNADAVFTPLAMGMNSRGDYEKNSGLFRPDDMVPVQFRGFSGANMKLGGEYYMDEDEIQNFLKMGGQIEIID